MTPTVPVRVDYALTPLGESLVPVMRTIKAWAERNMDEVLEARSEHDGARVAADPV
ncbi:winged helix-turn-helix transcriptional regulator [Streptomyces drozdowiczii]